MNRHFTTIGATVLGALLLAGCGGVANRTATHPTAPTTVSTTAAPSGTAALTSAVVAAVEADHKTSVAALWTNTVPAKPVATAGPALAALQQSVAARLARGIRVRMLSEQFRVISTTLDPSYTTATAVVVDVQHVQPSHNDGKPLGHPVTLYERAELQLRRVGESDQFVVWKVQTGK